MFAGFIRRLVAADTSSMTLALAGRFTPTPAMFELAMRSDVLLRELFDRVRPALRDDADVHDLSLIFEMIAAIKTPDRDRTLELRGATPTWSWPGCRPAPAPRRPRRCPVSRSLRRDQRPLDAGTALPDFMIAVDHHSGEPDGS